MATVVNGLYPHKMDPEKLRAGLMTMVEGVIENNEIPGSSIMLHTQNESPNAAARRQHGPAYEGDVVMVRTSYTIEIETPHVMTKQEAMLW